MDYLKEKMNDRFCKKCNHLCHCIEADHSDCACKNCECNGREEDKTYETGGVVIDCTQDCEACELNVFSISITICTERLLGRQKMCCYR